MAVKQEVVCALMIITLLAVLWYIFTSLYDFAAAEVITQSNPHQKTIIYTNHHRRK